MFRQAVEFGGVPACEYSQKSYLIALAGECGTHGAMKSALLLVVGGIVMVAVAGLFVVGALSRMKARKQGRRHSKRVFDDLI